MFYFNFDFVYLIYSNNKEEIMNATKLNGLRFLGNRDKVYFEKK